MSDVDSNGVDWLDRFRAYSERFKQFSVAEEVYLDTLKHIQEVRKERDEAKLKLGRIFNEIDCRIEHGAESNGHLEAIRKLFWSKTND